jgi:uncharacterized membrane protein
MSRTMLAGLTAAGLAVVALAIMATRYGVMGNEVKLPLGPNKWKVTMVVQGTSTGEARLQTASPLGIGRQHVLKESYDSEQLLSKPPEARNPDRRLVLWLRRAGAAEGPFRASCEYHVALEVPHPTAAMERMSTGVYAAPKPGEHLDPESRNTADTEEIDRQAAELCAGKDNKADISEALFRFVTLQIKNEPSIQGHSARAIDCLKDKTGDCAAKSRLLVALLRSRGVPARIVTGVTLTKGPQQRSHYWVEAWVYDHWISLCPFYDHFRHVPPTYLIFGYGDKPVVRGRNVKDVDAVFLVEREPMVDAAAANATPLLTFFRSISLYMLPPAEQRLVEILLLLPVAALIICVFRNLIGINSFGTFAPALVGLSFRELHSLPGFFVFVAILLVGWLMRRVLDRYHLLQVPRVSMMLTLIMMVLITLIIGANLEDLPATKYISLFPLVILTGMVERFWTLETEDGTASSFRTLLCTMGIAATISLVCSLHGLLNHLFRFPETLGLIMAAQLLIGRYTGYRFMELLRFRDFVKSAALTTPTVRYFDEGAAAA